MAASVDIALIIGGADFIVTSEVGAIAEVEQVVEPEWAVHRERSSTLVFAGGFAAAVVD